MSDRFQVLAPGNPLAVFDAQESKVFHLQSRAEADAICDLLNDLHEIAIQPNPLAYRSGYKAPIHNI